MKKYCMISGIAILGVICVMLAAVGRNSYQYTDIDKNVGNALNVGFTVEVGEDTVKLHICNNDEVDFFFGLQYGLEVWKNNKWEDVPRTGIWEAAGIYLTPGKEYVQKIITKELGAKSGRAYRIRKEINEYECYSEVFIMK